MADYPPPPPPPDGPGRPAGRPGIVTAAAALLILGGALGIVNGLLLLFVNDAGVGILIVAIITLAVAGLQVYAGVHVLNLRERGRRIGMILAIVAAVFAVLAIGAAPVAAVIQLVINGVILYALTQHREVFTA